MNGSVGDRRPHHRDPRNIIHLARWIAARRRKSCVVVIRGDKSPLSTEQFCSFCVPFRPALGTCETKRSSSTPVSPMFFPTTAPSYLWIFLAALGPLRHAYEAVKYGSIASVQCRAEMISGKLHIHSADFSVACSQRDGNLSFDGAADERKVGN
jgi:hypothetical protein